jgi:2-polyprenyl-3-methyl-5-hydroxy-6-metoxy-1,4-benzoquinol methylase
VSMTDPCHLCTRPLSDALTVWEQGRTGPLHTAACLRCGLVQTVPHPTEAEVSAYYESGEYRQEFRPLPVFELGEDLEAVRNEDGSPRYVDPTDERYGTMLDRAGMHTAKRLVATHGLGAGAKVMEIGCGDGRVAAAMVWHDLEVHALERDPRKAVEAEGHMENAWCGNRPATPRPTVDTVATRDGFDFVYALQVIEHFADPIAGLRDNVVRYAKVGGIVHVEVPTVERPYVSLSHFFQKPHVVNYSSDTLGEAMVLAGLTDVRVWIEGSVLVGVGVRAAEAPPAPEWPEPWSRAHQTVAYLHDWERRRLEREKGMAQAAAMHDLMSRLEAGQLTSPEEQIAAGKEWARFRDTATDAVMGLQALCHALDEPGDDWDADPYIRGFLMGGIARQQDFALVCHHIINHLIMRLNR